MPRLADRVLGRLPNYPGDDVVRGDDPRASMADLATSIPPLLSGSPVVDISNVAAYVARKPDMGDTPTIAPPWPMFWMEYRSGRNTVGLMFSSKDVEGGDLHDWQIEQRDKPATAPSDTRWVLSVLGYVDTPMGMYGPEAVWEFAVNERGQILESRYEKIMDLEEDAILPGLWALSFMHCRNIETTRVTPPEKVERKYRQKNRRGLVRYHVIVLQPMRGRKRSTTINPGTGEPQELRIFPGHYHHYGNCCPPSVTCPEEHGYSRCKRCGGHTPHGLLFGREGGEGMYWIEMHARGDRRLGQTVSDYTMDMSEASEN